jgi:hypothetical protein
MRCRSAEERIQELLDDRLDPAFDSELIDHAMVCPECRALLEGQGRLFDGVNCLTVPSLPPDFSRRVVGSVVLQPRSAQRFAPVVVSLAIIAMFFLAFALWPHLSSGLRPMGRDQAVASATMNPPQEGGANGFSMTSFDSREIGIAFKHFVQLANSEGARFQVDQLAGTIRPLASTLNVAFDAIRRSIPGQRHPARADPQARELHDPWTLRVI